MLLPMAMLRAPAPTPMSIKMNIFGDVFGDGLKDQKPYERPLLPRLIKDAPTSYSLQVMFSFSDSLLLTRCFHFTRCVLTRCFQEKMFSFSGEDFKVCDLSGQEIIQIDGGNINLGGWVLDKLAFKCADSGQKFCSVERRAIAASTCYDIYSPDGSELLAKVERDWMTMTPKYKVCEPLTPVFTYPSQRASSASVARASSACCPRSAALALQPISLT